MQTKTPTAPEMVTQAEFDTDQQRRREELVKRISTFCDHITLPGEDGDAAYDLLREAAARIGSDRLRFARHRHQSASPSGLLDMLGSLHCAVFLVAEYQPEKPVKDFADNSDIFAEVGRFLHSQQHTAAPATAGEGELSFERLYEVKNRAVHMAHCGQGEYSTTCKYGEDDCPALSTPSASGEAIEAAAWLYEKGKHSSLQRSRQEWNVDRGWTETPLYAALTQSPAPNDAVRELLREWWDESRRYIYDCDASRRVKQIERFQPRIDALLSAQPAPVEGVDLSDHFPTGLRSKRGYLPQTGEVFESPIQCECHCGEAFAGTDEQEVRQLWAAHIAALHPNTESGRTPVEHDGEDRL